MRTYLLFALGLALGDTKAEEPKECIDALNLTVEIKPSVYRAGIEGRIDSALQGVQKFYWREVDLPVTWKYQTERDSDDIHIIFGYAADCLQDWFPDATAIRDYYKLSQPTEQELQEELEDAIGKAYSAKREAYIFSPDIITDMERIESLRKIHIPLEKGYAKVIMHEIGHILGLEERFTRAKGPRYYVMGRNPYSLFLPSFSEDEREKIKAQMCQTTEQQ